MNAIQKLLGDPGWWFTAVFIGIIASLTASYIKDFVSRQGPRVSETIASGRKFWREAVSFKEWLQQLREAVSEITNELVDNPTRLTLQFMDIIVRILLIISLDITSYAALFAYNLSFNSGHVTLTAYFAAAIGFLCGVASGLLMGSTSLQMFLAYKAYAAIRNQSNAESTTDNQDYELRPTESHNRRIDHAKISSIVGKTIAQDRSRTTPTGRDDV